jgi:RNA polymerase sigma-70 factor (ECF subfamily)
MIDVLRRERRVTAREIAQDMVPDVLHSNQVVSDDIDVDAIHAAIAQLPARQRDVIRGLKFDDESVRDVAGRLGMSESAVKVTAHRGYRALRRFLGGRTGEN